HLEAVPELGAYARDEQPVVVHQEHPDRAVAGRNLRSGHGALRGAVRGILRLTSVPSRRSLTMVAAPPWRSIRPRMDSVIPRRSAGRFARSNPLPWSRM